MVRQSLPARILDCNQQVDKVQSNCFLSSLYLTIEVITIFSHGVVSPDVNLVYNPGYTLTRYTVCGKKHQVCEEVNQGRLRKVKPVNNWPRNSSGNLVSFLIAKKFWLQSDVVN